MNSQPLTTYLNDHLAGSSAGRDVAKHCCKHNPGTPLEIFLMQLLTEIDDEQVVLKLLLERFGENVNPLKAIVAWASQKATLVKFSSLQQGYSDLNRLQELEVLLLGVRGKLALWEALAATVTTDSRFDDVDLGSLREQAERQFKQLERHRLQAAQKAFLSKPSD